MTAIYGQRAITDLQPAHRTALESYLTSHKDRAFLPETRIDSDYLKVMREWLGASAKPFYVAADFNHDRLTDFAVILSRKGSPVRLDEDMAGTHNVEYPLTIVIFNGTKTGKFTAAFMENIQAPIVCALSVSGGRKKTLNWGVSETDNMFSFKPSGKSYVIEYPDMP